MVYSLFLLKKRVKRKLADNLVVQVNPAKIKWYVSLKDPYRKELSRKLKKILPAFLVKPLMAMVANIESFALSKKFYGQPLKIDETDRYVKVADLVRNRDDYKNTIWYRSLVTELNKNGFAKHKKIKMNSLDEIDQFMTSYALGLVESMYEKGYVIENEMDLPSVRIGANGELHKSSNSNHRFAVARELELPSIPVRVVGVHEDWIISEKITNLESLKCRIEQVAQRYL